MGKTLKYGEFEFGPHMHYSQGGACHSTGGVAKKATGGSCGYKQGGSVKKATGGATPVGVPTSVAPGHVTAKKGGSASKIHKAKGGVLEKETGERYSSKKAMEKHERSESPREQRQEMTKGKIPPARRSVPVAPQSPLLALRKGGKISEAKVGKVMNEFKAGDLHSGSKKGPDVTSQKQALAIALSEGRQAAKKK